MSNSNKPGYELIVRTEDIKNRHKITEAIELIRTGTSICLHSNGFWLVSKPTFANNMKGGALYEMLGKICDWYDHPAKGEEQTYREQIITAAVSALLIPLDIFADFDFFINVANDINHRRTELYKALAEKAEKPIEDTPESIAEDEIFVEMVHEAEAAKSKPSECNQAKQ